MDNTAKNHIWKVEPSCAKTGEGIFEGLAWLSTNVKLLHNSIPSKANTLFFFVG